MIEVRRIFQGFPLPAGHDTTRGSSVQEVFKTSRDESGRVRKCLTSHGRGRVVFVSKLAP